MPYVLGLHLGTTVTSAAIVRREAGRWASAATPVPLGSSGAVAPTAVCRVSNGTFLAGEAALHQQASYYEWVTRDFPRYLGADTPVALGNDFVLPQRLVAAVVEWVADVVAQRQGHPPEHIALAHPAPWGPHRIHLVLSELAQLGLTDVTAAPEPVAVAMDYAAKQPVDEHAPVVVGNAGGSGFDATVLRRRSGELAFDVVAPTLDTTHPGGQDLDDEILEMVRSELDQDLPTDTTDPNTRAALIGLRAECARAKETLTHQTETSIPVRLPGIHMDVALSRAKYERLARSHLERVPEILQQAVHSSPAPAEELSAVVLAGGTAHTPLLRRMVTERMEVAALVDRHPELVAAQGAALAGVRAVSTEADRAVRPAHNPSANETSVLMRDVPESEDVLEPEAAPDPPRPSTAVDPMPLDPPDEARDRKIKILKLSAAAVLIIIGLVLTFIYPPQSPLDGVLGAVANSD